MAKEIRLKKCSGKFPAILQGYKKFCEAFGCSDTTAWRLLRREGAPFRDAVLRQGRRVYIDTRKVLELGGWKNVDRFIQK